MPSASTPSPRADSASELASHADEAGVVNGAPSRRPRSPLVDEQDGVLPADLRLQILTTEHWSLLSTRALTWNEAFSRASMFLSVLTGSVLALALVAGVMGFDGAFVTFALVLLPVVLFAGVGTFRRLIEVNREDMRWVVGMNRLRYAYLESAPELRPYFVTGWTDDEAGIMTTFGARPGSGSFAHEFVTTPGLIAVVDGVVTGVLVALVGLQLDLGTVVSLALGVTSGIGTVGLLAWVQYRLVIRPRGLEPRFPQLRPEQSIADR
jgi:hypothetical protein